MDPWFEEGWARIPSELLDCESHVRTFPDGLETENRPEKYENVIEEVALYIHSYLQKLKKGR